VRGYTMTKQQYLARLRRIEGQVLGLQRQIEEDTYCISGEDGYHLDVVGVRTAAGKAQPFAAQVHLWLFEWAPPGGGSSGLLTLNRGVGARHVPP
jgi:hypothetical protein